MNDAVRLQSVDAKCANCGNSLKYSPRVLALQCVSCGATVAVDDTTSNVKEPYDGVNDDALVEWQNQSKYIKCKCCGSTITLSNNEISIDCPYCDSQNVILPEEVEGLYPRFILRFGFDKKDASEKFVAQVKKKFFVPRPFKKAIPENSIEGFYFPSFAFDADSASKYSGRLYRYEHVGSGKEMRTITVHFNISGEITLAHRDVLVESSARLNQYELEKMFPFEFDKKVDFRTEYLFGYTVEQYTEQFKYAVNKGEAMIHKDIEHSILSRYSYDGVDSLKVDTKLSDKSFGYYMMPIYTFEYHYKNKKYLTHMNGQTGKVGGGLPISKLKVSFVAILVLLVIIVPIVLCLVYGAE